MYILPPFGRFAHQASRPEPKVELLSICSNAPVTLDSRTIAERLGHSCNLKVLETDLRIRQIWSDFIIVCVEIWSIYNPHEIKVHELVEVVKLLACIGVVFAREIAKVREILVMLQYLLFYLEKLRVMVLYLVR